jgi:hypothetical protein
VVTADRVQKDDQLVAAAFGRNEDARAGGQLDLLRFHAAILSAMRVTYDSRVIKRSLAVAAAVAAAAQLSADTIGDVKAALRLLHAKTPIRATYDTKSTNVAHGRFFNQDETSAATVDTRVGEEGVTIVYPRALLDRGAAQRNAVKRDASAQHVADVSATRVAELLDFAPALLALLERASVAEEHFSTVNAQQARLIVMNLRERDDQRVKQGHVDVTVNRLSLWIGADSLPLVAERESKFTAGIFFLKADGNQTEKWTFVRRDDRLIVSKYERFDSSSGMGQTSHNNETETITVR